MHEIYFILSQQRQTDTKARKKPLCGSGFFRARKEPYNVRRKVDLPCRCKTTLSDNFTTYTSENTNRFT